MLLDGSRRAARFRDSELVLLADQDRSPWDPEQIANGRMMLDRALALGGRGPSVVQAASASLHAEEPRELPQLAELYGEPSRSTSSPIAELNRAVVIALDDYRDLHSTRGELLFRLGRTEEAGAAYRRALALIHDGTERRLFEPRLAKLATTTNSAGR